MEKEQRFIPIERIEVREGEAEGEADAPTGIAGLAALYNTRTVIGGMFEEEIAPGAFDDALKSSDVRALFNHDANFPLGRSTAGTLELRGTDEGLEYEVPELPRSRADVLEAIQRGDVTGNSFSFTVAEDEEIDPDEREDGGELPLRIIKRIGTLYDVGPVTFPAYEETTVSARTQEWAKRAKEQPEPDPEPEVDDAAAAARERTLRLLRP